MGTPEVARKVQQEKLKSFIDTLLIEDLPSLYGGSGTTQMEDSTNLCSDGDQEPVSQPAVLWVLLS